MKRAEFDEFVAEHHCAVCSYLCRLCSGNRSDAEDLAQEVFMRAWAHFAKLEGCPRGWLVTTARNVWIDFCRRCGSRSTVPLPDTLIDRAKGTSPEVKIDLDVALGHLSAEWRDLLELRYYAGLTLQEIASTLARPLSTVNGQINQAEEQLRALLEKRAVVMGGQQ